MAKLKRRILEEYLDELEGFKTPKVHLEQYITSSHVASHLLHTAQTSFSDLEGKSVADLGCGCGALTLGAAALGASYTVGFEIDVDAVEVFHKNAKRLGLPGQWNIQRSLWNKEITGKTKVSSREKAEIRDADRVSGSTEEEESENTSDNESSSDSSFDDVQCLPDSSVDIVLCDVISGEGLGSSNCRWHKSVDTVVMNPPFGTKNNHGADMAFLKSALGMARTAVYSLHKTSTRNYVLAKGKEWGGQGTAAEVLAQLHFDLPKSYRFHNKKSVDIEVDFIRFGFNNAAYFVQNFSRSLIIR